MLKKSILSLSLSLGLLSAQTVLAGELTPAGVIKELDLRESTQAARDMPGWSKPKKIVALADTPQRLAWLQEAVPGVEVVGASGWREAMGLVGDADAIVGLCAPPLIEAAKVVKWVHIGSAGINECANAPKLLAGGVLVTNMQRVYGPPMSEHVIALAFALARNFRYFEDLQEKSEWNQTALVPERFTELGGKTMLVVGLGGIGTDIAKRAHALGMRVIATRNSSREKPDYVEYVGLADELMTLVPQADFIANAAPLTAQTQGIFNAGFFAKMKPSAFFINVGRGQQVVQPDLIVALEKKVIAGAAIDVADPEPLPKDHPLWKAPNLIITPHTSSFSERRFERFWVVLRENMRRYAAGEKMLSVVDVKRGY
ncbi:MAG: D-2-hydroxyacid dehydrogenase [Rhodospirillaceae bacterium]|nr:D-2-hydroxyacid dehydrogenase [Rhodospirillaceae bacterium]